MQATIRATSHAGGAAANLTPALPAGTAVGDMVIAIITAENQPTVTTAGWVTVASTTGTTAWINGIVVGKVMKSAADITAGGPTATTSSANSMSATMVAYQAGTFLTDEAIEVVYAARSQNSGGASTSPAFVGNTNDGLLYYSTARGGTAPVITGTSAPTLESFTQGTLTSLLLAEGGPQPSRTVTFTASTGGSGYVDWLLRVPGRANVEAENPSPTGVIQVKAVGDATESVIPGMDLTVTFGVQAYVGVLLTVSMSHSGVAKGATARLRDGGPTGTVLASQAIPDSGDSTAGTATTFFKFFAVTPATSRLCVTIQNTTNSADIYTANRLFTVASVAYLAPVAPTVLPLGQAQETDAAEPVVPVVTVSSITIAVGQAVETDTATPLAVAQTSAPSSDAALTGAGGSYVNPGVWPAVLSYTPDVDGSLVMQVDAPDGWLPVYVVTNADGEEVQTDVDGVLDVVWSADEPMTITITPGDGADPSVEVAFGWSYAARASSVLTVAMDYDYVLETPAGLEVDISNGVPGDTVTLTLIGPTTTADFQTVTLDEYGQALDLTVDLPAATAGAYLLRVESGQSGTEDVDLTIQEDALSWDDTERALDVAPVVDAAQHWRFYDLRDHAVTWTFPRNPSSWTNVFPPNDFTHDNTTAPDGQPLTWQAAARPWRMEFTGFLDTQEEYEQLVFWSQLRRRFWLIDHRNRAWLMTIEQFDATALIKANLPWAHDYTVKTLIFMQGTD